MKALLKQHGLAAALEELPVATIVAYDNVIRTKSYSALILYLGDRVLREITKKTTAMGIWKKLETLYMKKSSANRLYLKKKLYTFHMHPGKSQSKYINEFHKLVGDLKTIDIVISDEDQALLLLTSLPSSYDNFVETLLYGWDIVKLEDGDGGEGFYVRGRSGQRDMERGTNSTLSKSHGRSSRLKCYICQAKEHLKMVSGSGANEYESADVMLAMSVEELLDSIMDSGGSYHMTYKRDYLFDFEEYDGDDTTMSTYLVNSSPSMAIGFKTPIDMLESFGYLASIKQGMLEPVKVKRIFVEYREGMMGYKLWRLDDVTSKGVLYINMGVEFEVEPHKDHAFEVEPHGNVDHVVGSQEVQTQDLIDYHSAVDKEQHSAREQFRVACEEISNWKARLKEDMDAQSDVYVLSNGCRKGSDDRDDYYWEYTLAKKNVLGLKIDVDQSGNTLRVSHFRVHNEKFVQTLLEGHSILSLEDSL
ncbi:hypothetical protein Tco_1087297 [Tanacetum coccineum]